MKSFKSFISEAEGPIDPKALAAKKASQGYKTSERQQREKEAMKIRHEREKAKAREFDFKKKETDKAVEIQRKAAQAKAKAEETLDPTESMCEYLEDGTEELVQNYEKSLKS